MTIEKSLIFLKKANKLALNSKDQSTKVGSFVVGEDGFSLVGFGYNGMPRGFPDDDVEKNKRPEKYLWYEHAERNAIYNSVQKNMELEQAIIILNRFPNMEAMRAIVSCGIKKIIVPEIEQRENYKKVLEMIQYGSIELIETNNPQNKSLKMVNKYKNYIDLCHEYAEDLAHEYSEVKESALIMNGKTLSPISMSVSGPPQNMQVSPEKIEKEGVSFWIQEAAKNAIFNIAKKSWHNSTAYVSWCPCAHCALALASVEVKKVVTYEPDFTKEADLRWKDHFIRSKEVFKSLNIEFEAIPVNIELNKKNKVVI